MSSKEPLRNTKKQIDIDDEHKVIRNYDFWKIGICWKDFDLNLILSIILSLHIDYLNVRSGINWFRSINLNVLLQLRSYFYVRTPNMDTQKIVLCLTGISGSSSGSYNISFCLVQNTTLGFVLH